MAKHSDDSKPKFPYTTSPSILRRALAAIPKKPKPDRVSAQTLVSWGVSTATNGNTTTSVTVLKRLGLLASDGAPTSVYADFMRQGVGPGALGARMREVYKPLFEASHDPSKESEAELKNLFNIHSGGGDDAMRLQIQTFRALAEFANLEAGKTSELGAGVEAAPADRADRDGGALPAVQVALHIHLPENKSSRDYEAIIQDIARYIYGRDIERN